MPWLLFYISRGERDIFRLCDLFSGLEIKFQNATAPFDLQYKNFTNTCAPPAVTCSAKCSIIMHSPSNTAPLLSSQHRPDYRNPNAATTSSSPYFTGRYYWFALTLLVLLFVADNVLVVVLFDTFGERYAQYINQGTAFVYIVWSSIILLARRFRRPNIYSTPNPPTPTDTDKKTIPPPWILIGIGLFNGSGNFLMAIAQPHTPGLTQTLLNLLGIPLVLLLSSLFLNKVSTTKEWCGAGLIVLGTCVSGLRTLLESDHVPSVTNHTTSTPSSSSSSSSLLSPSSATSSPAIVAYVGSVLLYASAQLFLSGEKIWEEWSFTTFQKLDPMVMFWYTLVTQFMLGWFLYPLQTLPAFGNITLANIPSVIGNGVLCTFGQNTGHTNPCGPFNAIIFFVYCSVDFWCYFFGLWVIQKGGANLMVVTIAIALPLQQLVLCMKILLGKYSELFFWGDSVALVFVLLGFLLYQSAQPNQTNNNTASHQARLDAHTLVDHAKEKALVAQTHLNASRQRRRSSANSVVRSVLSCEQCERLERGMCDDCRRLFKSNEWLGLHPEWKAKQAREEKEKKEEKEEREQKKSSAV